MVYGSVEATENPIQIPEEQDSESTATKKFSLKALAAIAFVVATAGVYGSRYVVATNEPVQLSSEAATAEDQTTKDLNMLIDQNATEMTKELYVAMKQMMQEKGILFGHQMTNWNAQHWTHAKDDGKYDNSDVNTGTGDWPVMFGYDMLKLLDGNSFTDHAKWVFENGGIVNFYWEAKNPSNNADSYNWNNMPCTDLMPGGEANSAWNTWLDEIAEFAKGLTVNGKHVPIVFRLFHENSGFWYWWGSEACSSTQFIAAWRYTVSYLKDYKQVHNIIYAYAPAKPSDYYDLGFNEMYPGDDWVDVISWDRYGTNSSYQSDITADCDLVVPFAIQHKKVVALGETGIKDGVQDCQNPDWFYDEMIVPLTESNTCRNLSYLLTYTNYKESEYWVPLPGQPTFPGFMSMYESDRSVFLGDSRWQQTKYYRMANSSSNHAVEVKSTHSNKAHFHGIDVQPK